MRRHPAEGEGFGAADDCTLDALNFWVGWMHRCNFLESTAGVRYYCYMLLLYLGRISIFDCVQNGHELCTVYRAIEGINLDTYGSNMHILHQCYT